MNKLRIKVKLETYLIQLVNDRASNWTRLPTTFPHRNYSFKNSRILFTSICHKNYSICNRHLICICNKAAMYISEVDLELFEIFLNVCYVKRPNVKYLFVASYSQFIVNTVSILSSSDHVPNSHFLVFIILEPLSRFPKTIH